MFYLKKWLQVVLFVIKLIAYSFPVVSTSSKSTIKTTLVNCGPACFYTIFQYLRNVYEGLSREHYAMPMNFENALNFFFPAQ